MKIAGYSIPVCSGCGRAVSEGHDGGGLPCWGSRALLLDARARWVEAEYDDEREEWRIARAAAPE